MLYKEKILLIHKSQKIKETIITYLRELDYAVIVANSVEDAYNLSKTTEPDIIVWGSSLTSDSKKVLRRIKRSSFAKNVPILAMIDDIELYERIELEKNGIHDVITLDPNLTELRLRIKLHLEHKAKNIDQEKEIKRLQNISEVLYNFSIVTDINDISDLLNDFLGEDYSFDFILHLIYNPSTGDYDYKKFITENVAVRKNANHIYEQPTWKDLYFSNPNLKIEKISNSKVLSIFKTVGIESEVYYQIPIMVEKTVVGIILTGCLVKDSLSAKDINQIGVLAKSAAQKILEVKNQSSKIDEQPEEKIQVENLFKKFKEDEIFEFLNKKVLSKLKTDVSIYLNYNKGFRFLYPQFCFKKGNPKNQFETEKPPVLMVKELPTFEKFIDSKERSKTFKISEESSTDLAKIIQLSGDNYKSVIVFSVEIANEVQGYILAANESIMKRFSSTQVVEAEKLIQKATDVLMESRLIKQANQTIKQLDRVFELGKDLTLESHIDVLLPKIASAIRRTLGWNIVIIDKIEAYTGEYKNVCHLGIQDKIYESISSKYPKTMYSQLKTRSFKQSNSYFLDHKFAALSIQEDEINNFQLKIGKQWNDRDWLFIPILSRGRELGVISVNDPVDRIRPSNEKVRSLEYFANQAAVALENDALFENLKSSETKYRELSETMTMGLVSFKINGDIVYNNPSFSELMQFEKGTDLVGRNIYTMCADKSSVSLEKYIASLSKPETDVSIKEYEAGIEIELLGNDNTFVPFKIYLTKSFDSGREKEFVAVLADLRPQRRIEILKSDFNSMIVHDLRSPLNIIQGYIDIVRNKIVGEISSEQEELLGIAKENCYKVLKLVDNFLIASKMEVGSFDVTPEVNALNTLLESVSENHKILADKKSIKLNIKIDHKIPLLAFDKMRVEQVISNYLSNAIKFTNEGGEIEIGNKLVSTKKEITGENLQEIQVWVKDSGVGIEKDEQDKVFNKYAQTEAGKDASLKGTGLGLAICKEIITLHRGKVWLTSDFGKGSTFYFSLPVLLGENVYIPS